MRLHGLHVITRIKHKSATQRLVKDDERQRTIRVAQLKGRLGGAVIPRPASWKPSTPYIEVLKAYMNQTSSVDLLDITLLKDTTAADVSALHFLP